MDNKPPTEPHPAPPADPPATNADAPADGRIKLLIPRDKVKN